MQAEREIQRAEARKREEEEIKEIRRRQEFKVRPFVSTQDICTVARKSLKSSMAAKIFPI